MDIVFKKIRDRMQCMNPFKDFAPDEIPFEIRFDPLTGQTTRIFGLPYKPPPRPDFDSLVAKSLEVPCPFCPGSVEKATPLYPEDLIPGGRIRVGEAWLFPNLLPLDRHTGVCVLSGDHFIPIEDFTPERITDAFRACLRFVREIALRDPGARYFNINWNYMTPAGSSMIHPHLQVNAGEFPTRQLQLQMEASQRYFQRNHRTFWEDYIQEEEARDERIITCSGPAFWTLSFAPQSALPDFWCIFPDRSTLIELTDEDLDPFLRGLAGAIRYFDREGLYSFNVSMFSGRESDHFRVNARVAPRLLLRESGNSDQTYFQVLHREPCSIKAPESVREEVMKEFG